LVLLSVLGDCTVVGGRLGRSHATGQPIKTTSGEQNSRPLGYRKICASRAGTSLLVGLGRWVETVHRAGSWLGNHPAQITQLKSPSSNGSAQSIGFFRF